MTNKIQLPRPWDVLVDSIVQLELKPFKRFFGLKKEGRNPAVE